MKATQRGIIASIFSKNNKGAKPQMDKEKALDEFDPDALFEKSSPERDSAFWAEIANEELPAID